MLPEVFMVTSDPACRQGFLFVCEWWFCGGVDQVQDFIAINNTNGFHKELQQIKRLKQQLIFSLIKEINYFNRRCVLSAT